MLGRAAGWVWVWHWSHFHHTYAPGGFLVCHRCDIRSGLGPLLVLRHNAFSFKSRNLPGTLLVVVGIEKSAAKKAQIEML